LDTIKQAMELMKLKNEALSTQGMTAHSGLFLQTMQLKQSFVDKASSPIGQTSMHILHLV
jgi:hypothetical protein